MPYPTTSYRWTWDLAASIEALWPLVSDTDRFNRDCGFPSVKEVPAAEIKRPRADDARRLRAHHLGLVVEWDERPFEWVTHRSFGVDRHFHSGPFSRILARCDLESRGAAGTRLVYQTWFTPASMLGVLALKAGGAHWQFFRPFDRVFRHYDQLAQAGQAKSDLGARQRFSPGGRARLQAISETLERSPNTQQDLVAHLSKFVSEADDMESQRIRAYELADRWQADRRKTLQTCLQATRAGLLDFRWDVICPHCRGAKAVSSHLDELQAAAHCDTCRIDFTAEFDRSVELTFRPNPAVRRVPRVGYCVGGPQVTPHIAIQQTISAGGSSLLTLDLQPGRYRARCPVMERPWTFTVTPEGGKAVSLRLEKQGAPGGSDNHLAPGAELALYNSHETSQLVVIEHLAWSDQATTASEVTSLQLFRDLFAKELLRPGNQIAVSSLTMVFTDLKNSTQLYRNIGDAPAFSRVLTHFEILKAAIDAENGAIVKTMGDAVMAVFPRPASAVRAMVAAQRQLALSQSSYPWIEKTPANPLPEPFALKVGIHQGHCIVITQNDRLDYFGTTVNVAARLCSLSTGADLVLSDTVRSDPEVAQLLDDPALKLRAGREQTQLRGLADEIFDVHRAQRG